LDLIRRIRCFGINLMTLDIRQESSVHEEAMDSIFSTIGKGSYSELPEKERILGLETLTLSPPQVDFNQLTPMAREVLDTLKVAAKFGAESMGAYVVSMAEAPSDILEVLFLQKL